MLESKLKGIIAKLPLAIREAELAGAELVVKAAQERVPVGTREPHLRDAIHVQETDEAVLVVGGDREAFYGHIVEHGSVKAPAHPFLVPALEASKPAIVELLRKAVQKAVEE